MKTIFCPVSWLHWARKHHSCFWKIGNKGNLPEAIQNKLKALPHPWLQGVFGTVCQEDRGVKADSDSENSEYDSS